MESTSCELALKPSLDNNNPIIYTLFHLVRGTPVFRATTVSPGGNTYFPRIWCLARGKHPHSAHLSLARSEHPLRPQGFGSLPISRPGLGETPYTTRTFFPADSASVIPLYPGQGGYPLMSRRSHPHVPDSSLCGVSPAGTGSQITLNQNRSLALPFVLPTNFPSF